MSHDDEWSPDEPSGTEAFEQGDEALDEGTRTDPDLLESVENDPSLDPTLQVDTYELEEAGADLDDPDGRGRPSIPGGPRRPDEEGWDLDAPIARSNETDEDSTD
ncbi:MAG TPA: hypothetical protein VND62_01785 [Acidimicrobiales bacterium]|nr:hypothetical protein [Acidimicrobiales bacterium]